MDKNYSLDYPKYQLYNHKDFEMDEQNEPQTTQSYTPPPLNSNTHRPLPSKTETIALIGFVLSLIAVFVPFLPLVSVTLCIIGIVQIKKNSTSGKGLAISGLVIAVLALTMHVFIIARALSSSDVDEIKPTTTSNGSVTSKENLRTGEQTVNSYISYVESGANKRAYALTSNDFQEATSYDAFVKVADIYRENNLASAEIVLARSQRSNTSGSEVVYGYVYSIVPKTSDDYTHLYFVVDANGKKIHTSNIVAGTKEDAVSNLEDDMDNLQRDS